MLPGMNLDLQFIVIGSTLLTFWALGGIRHIGSKLRYACGLLGLTLLFVGIWLKVTAD